MLKLKVPDMSCGHCSSTVEKSVRSVDPAAAVDVDLGAKIVSIRSEADENKIREAISTAGYPNEKLAA